MQMRTPIKELHIPVSDLSKTAAVPDYFVAKCKYLSGEESEIPRNNRDKTLEIAEMPSSPIVKTPARSSARAASRNGPATTPRGPQRAYATGRPTLPQGGGNNRPLFVGPRTQPRSGMIRPAFRLLR
ncbi:hypothetical protein EKO27_g11921 [Xylaria grammica]|uniref:Uncharacterized protein n=1 Tax=Xylaria grammica TaxID=363999 RepID=A0A439CLZ1_9PEZI|nr:hypothetical protein EKO27_g11921 [Xylaria grammica]